MPPQEPKTVSIPLSSIVTPDSTPMDQKTADATNEFDVKTSLDEVRSLLLEVRDLLTDPKELRAAYSIQEVAGMLGKSSYTVREWCRHGRIHATKRPERRGSAELWSISSAETARYKNEGLLPLDMGRNAGIEGRPARVLT